MGTYQVRVALDELFGPDDLELDLRTDRRHPLYEHDVRIAATPGGGVSVTLSLTASDLWAAVLGAMGLIRHIGYVPTALDAAAVSPRARA